MKYFIGITYFIITLLAQRGGIYAHGQGTKLPDPAELFMHNVNQTVEHKRVPSWTSMQHVLASYHPPVKKKLIVMILSYNNALFYRFNLESILTQSYDNYHVIYVDDCSTDGTADLVQAHVDATGSADRVTLIRHTQRMHQLQGVFDVLDRAPDDSIIVTVDGDDALLPGALDLINKVYCITDPALKQEIPKFHIRVDGLLPTQEVWMTFGSFVLYPKGRHARIRKYTREEVNTASYRSAPFNAGHPRTFYAWLAKKIKREDLLINGTLPAVSYDTGLSFAMLEMAAGRFFFIPDILAVYNRSNPINDDKVKKDLQTSIVEYYRQRAPRYAALEARPGNN